MKFKLSTADQSGFTFLEVMIALAVLAGVLVTVIATVNRHIDVASGDRDIITASLIGRVKAEEVAMTGVKEAVKGPMEGEIGKFKWSLSSEGTGVEDLRRISVRVKWDNEEEVEFTSYRQER